MASRFRTLLTAVPRVKITLSGTGVSTTIGGQAARTSVGGLRADEAGTDRASRSRYISQHPHDGPLPTDPFLIAGTKVEYGSADVGGMTSAGLASFKQLLLGTERRRAEIGWELRKARVQLLWAQTKHVMAWMSLTALVPSVRRATAGGVMDRQAEIATLRTNLENTVIAVDFDMRTEIAGPYRRMQQAFDALRASSQVWSVETEQRIDRVRARAWAETVVGRKPVGLTREASRLVHTADQPLAFETRGGRTTAYVYPGFVLMQSRDDFALVDFADLTVEATGIRFSDSGAVPNDSEIVGETWAKANKDGTRDKRFKHNRKIPIMQYSGLKISSPGGLNEAYLVSRALVCETFARALNEVKAVLCSGTAARPPKSRATRALLPASPRGKA